MNYIHNSYTGPREVLAANVFKAIPITVAMPVGGNIVKAGTPLKSDGTATTGESAVGILLYDVDTLSNPNGSVMVAWILDSAKAQEISGVTYASALYSALPLVQFRTEEGGDEPSEPKVTVLFGTAAYSEFGVGIYEYDHVPIYVKAEGYELEGKTVALWIGESEYVDIEAAYEEVQPGDEVPYDYLYLQIPLEENTDPEYSGYQYSGEDGQFAYNDREFCIVLAEMDDQENYFVIGKTKSTMPGNPLELTSAILDGSYIKAEYNRPICTRVEYDKEYLCYSTTVHVVGEDVTSDLSIENLHDYVHEGVGEYDVATSGFEPGDLYIVTCVDVFDIEDDDYKKIVTTCSEKIVIPGTPEE